MENSNHNMVLMMAKKYWLLILKIIFVIGLINAVRFLASNYESKYQVCLERKVNWKQTILRGKVMSKYIDSSNHLLPTIDLLYGKKLNKIAIVWDESGLFDFVSKGDSLQKGENTLKVTIYRDKSVFYFHIDPNCEQYKN